MRKTLPALLFALAFLAACAGGGSRTETLVPVDAEPGDVVEGSVEDLESTLASMRGQPVVVNYWATWCEPCKIEMPILAQAALDYEGRVHFLGVNVEDDIEAARRFVQTYNVPFDSVGDPQGDIRRSEGLLGLPVTQFYAADGELTFVHNGEIRDDDLRQKIQDVLRLS